MTQVNSPRRKKAPTFFAAQASNSQYDHSMFPGRRFQYDGLGRKQECGRRGAAGLSREGGGWSREEDSSTAGTHGEQP